MRVRFEELAAPKRAGGIEAATRGLFASLENMGVSVTRCGEGRGFFGSQRPDCVHVHGIWSPSLMARMLWWRQLGVPCIVSAHGMLQPWALAHKPKKKRFAWSAYQRAVLSTASALHATSEQEAEGLRSLGMRNRIEVIPWGINIPDQPTDRELWLTGTARRTVLFVGRLYPVKGLPMLVSAWAAIRPVGWKVKVVGPDEAGHLEHIKRLASALGVDGDFEFAGWLEGGQLSRAFENADLFVMPSHTENFGLAIGEALAHGLPAIATQATPWSGLAYHRCGWWVPTSEIGIAAALGQATSLSDAERKRMGIRGRAWMLHDFSWPAVASQMSLLYRSVSAPRS